MRRITWSFVSAWLVVLLLAAAVVLVAVGMFVDDHPNAFKHHDAAPQPPRRMLATTCVRNYRSNDGLSSITITWDCPKSVSACQPC